MIKNLWRSFIGCVKWVAWLVTFALLVNATLVFGLLVTPVLFFFLWRAKTTAEVFFEGIADIVAKRVAEEFEKASWKIELENDDDENVF